MNGRYKKAIKADNKRTHDRLDKVYSRDSDKKVGYDDLDGLLNNFKKEKVNGTEGN